MKPAPHPLVEVVLLFFRLGATAFGGPAAHVALMRDEVVARRKWLTDAQFLDLLGATNLIPGPNSTEMTMHIGYLRAGMPGLFAGGAAFILPAMVIVMALAWAYTQYGSTPQAAWLFYGIQPVIIAVIFQALYALGRTAVKGPVTAAAGAAVLVLYLLGANEILTLLGAGLVVMVVKNLARMRGGPPLSALGLTLPLLPYQEAKVAVPLPARLAASIQTLEARVFAFFTTPTLLRGDSSQPVLALLASPYTLPVLFLTFLKIGSVLYGSGYVLLAFLRADFVERLGWLTDRQLLDAVAVGQITPGPLFTTATFIGYLMGGVPGAVVATVGIFLPGFFFVAISNPIIPRLRASPWAGALLDGVNVASLGLMAGVTIHLAQASLVDALTVLLALASAAAIIKFRVNTTWLVLAGALVGVISRFFFD